MSKEQINNELNKLIEQIEGSLNKNRLTPPIKSNRSIQLGHIALIKSNLETSKHKIIYGAIQ